jgi:hypothetical protein
MLSLTRIRIFDRNIDVDINTSILQEKKIPGNDETLENRVYRRGSYVLADVLAMDNSTVGAAPRLFCGFFLK